MRSVSGVPVRFSGGRARIGPATQGQANLLRVMQSGTSMCLDAVLPLPPGTTAEQVADALRVLILRHEAMRTLFRLGDPPEQVVVGSGEIPLVVYDAGTADPGRRIELIRETHWGRPFSDVRTDLPTKAAVLSVDGVLTHVVVAMSHVTVDAIALGIVMAELDDLLHGQALPAGGPQPLDLVPAERTPQSIRRLERTHEYWQRILETAPHTLFGYRPFAEEELCHVSDEEPCHVKLAIRSKALAGAVHRAARRIGVSPGTVVMTAFTVLVAHRCGVDRCPVVLPTSNRFRPGLERHVGQLASDSFMVVDLRGARGFDGTAKLVLRESLRAYWNSRYEAKRLWAQFAEAAGRRGFYADAREAVFSGMAGVVPDRYGQMGVGTPRPDRPEPDDPLLWDRLDDTMSWMEDEPHVSHLSLDLFAVDDEFAAVLQGAPTSITRAEVVDFGWALKRLLTAAGDGDVDLGGLAGLTSLRPIPRAGRYLEIDGGWADPAAVQDLLRSVAGAECRVVAVPDRRLGHRLVGHVPDAGAMTLEALHRACVAALPRQGGVMTPHEYVIHSPNLIQGTGRAS